MLRFAFSGFAMAVLSGSAAAEPLDAAAFERLARGRTLHFTLDGLPFGSEQFFDGRRSLWRFTDGECGSGGWWDQGG
jgi:hypothetical protein